MTNLSLLLSSSRHFNFGSFWRSRRKQDLSINEIAYSVSHDAVIAGSDLFRCLLVPEIGRKARVLQLDSTISIGVQSPVIDQKTPLRNTLYIFLWLSYYIEKPCILFDSFIFDDSRVWSYNDIFAAAKTGHHSRSERDTLVSVQHVARWLPKVLCQHLTHQWDSCGSADEQHFVYILNRQLGVQKNIVERLDKTVENLHG